MNAGTLIFAALIVGVALFMTRLSRKSALGDESKPIWMRQELTKEQHLQARAQYMAFRQQVYAEYPEADQFERNKRRWMGFLVLMGLALMIAKAVMLSVDGEIPFVALLLSALIGYAPTLVILLVASGPVRGLSWKIVFILYALGIVNIWNYIETLSQNGVHSLEEFLMVYNMGNFRQFPLSTGMDVLSWAHAILILLTAVWLTLIPRNRMLAQQSEILNAQMQSFTPDI